MEHIRDAVLKEQLKGMKIVFEDNFDIDKDNSITIVAFFAQLCYNMHIAMYFGGRLYAVVMDHSRCRSRHCISDFAHRVDLLLSCLLFSFTQGAGGGGV